MTPLEQKPELLLPAGSLSKVVLDLQYGADAVYVGGRQYSLRAQAGNLDAADMAQAIDLTHAQGKKIYAAVNIFARNADLTDLPDYLTALAAWGADGVIVSDLGVLRQARVYAPKLPVTLSTQANVTNYEAALFYQELGVQRIVLARELSLEEIRAIKENTDLEIEVFVHGAMCVSYSGRCLLSYYMTGRDANRGVCAHPCRYSYHLRETSRPESSYDLEEDARGVYILNANDLCLLEAIPDLADAGVDAFKVEGRMKNQLYLASVGGVYRQAVDTWREEPAAFAGRLPAWREELEQTATRPLTAGFLYGGSAAQDIGKSPPRQGVAFAGIVVGYDFAGRRAVVEQRAPFAPGDTLEFFSPGLHKAVFTLPALWDVHGAALDRARHAREHVLIDWPAPLPEGTILRRREP
jgi:putative protease